MGAGCYYTLPDNREIKAYWIDLDFQHEDGEADDYQSAAFDYLKDDLAYTLQQLPLFYVGADGAFYYGKLYRIDLAGTYNGDGLILNLAIDLPEYDRCYPLALANLDRVYAKIMRHVNRFYTLSVACSGYTSARVDIGALQ